MNTSDKDKHDHRQNGAQDGQHIPPVKTFQCNSTCAGSDMVSMRVVPVRVSHKQSNIVINTYAFTKDVRREMNLKGKGTTITVKTLNGEVSDFGQEFVRWLRILKSYTRKNIPVDRSTIPMEVSG